MARRSLKAVPVWLAASSLAIVPAGAGPGDVVLNPGPVTFTATDGGFLNLAGRTLDIPSTTTPTQCSDGLNNDVDFLGAGEPQDEAIDAADPECASPDDDSEVAGGFQPRTYIALTGNVDRDGTVWVPQAGISFPVVHLFVRSNGLGVPVDVTPAATGDSTGHLDPGTGELTTAVYWELSISNALFFDCVAPVSMVVSTEAAHPTNAGTIVVSPEPYSSATGSATVSSNWFEVGRAVPGPRVPTTQQTCDALVNSQLGLPAPVGASAVELHVTSDVAFQSGRA